MLGVLLRDSAFGGMVAPFDLRGLSQNLPRAVFLWIAGSPIDLVLLYRSVDSRTMNPEIIGNLVLAIAPIRNCPVDAVLIIAALDEFVVWLGSDKAAVILPSS